MDAEREAGEAERNETAKSVKPSERLGPWIGYLTRNGFDGARERSDTFVREARGSLEDETQT